MKIRYSKNHLNGILTAGIVFAAIGIVCGLFSFVADKWKTPLVSMGVSQILGGVFLFTFYFFEKKKHYLTLENGNLIKNSLIPKRLKLADIESFREFAGDLKLTTREGEFIINTQIIDPASLKDLKNELEKYNLK